MTQASILTVPGRGHFAAADIRAIAVEPRTNVCDRATGERCEAILIIETKRYSHRIAIPTLAQAEALLAEGLRLMQLAAMASVTVKAKPSPAEITEILRERSIQRAHPAPATAADAEAVQ